MNKATQNYVLAGAALLAVGLGYAVYSQVPQEPPATDPVATTQQTENGDPTAAVDAQSFPILGAEHITRGRKATYNSNPPTSGQHYATTVNWGEYDKPLQDELAVHLLEHGGIWISYQPDLETGALDQLRQIAKKYPNAVFLAPRPRIESKIALAAWGKLLNLETADVAKIDSFINKFTNQSPEKLASLAKQLGPVVGELFPDFNLVDLDGKTISLSALAGKPAIVWFTAGWCVPCQIGAKVVAKLDDELGGNAFDVVVVFVDPRETEKDLKDWKTKFASPDWAVAFDSKTDPLAQKLSLKYLDSKYLLDAKGILQNADFKIADAKYLTTIRGIVAAN